MSKRDVFVLGLNPTIAQGLLLVLHHSWWCRGSNGGTRDQTRLVACKAGTNPLSPLWSLQNWGPIHWEKEMHHILCPANNKALCWQRWSRSHVAGSQGLGGPQKVESCEEGFITGLRECMGSYSKFLEMWGTKFAVVIWLWYLVKGSFTVFKGTDKMAWIWVSWCVYTKSFPGPS